MGGSDPAAIVGALGGSGALGGVVVKLLDVLLSRRRAFEREVLARLERLETTAGDTRDRVAGVEGVLSGLLDGGERRRRFRS